MIQKLPNYILISILLTSNYAMAVAVSNGFFITQKSLDFDKHLVSGKCYGRITYPEFSSEDVELFNEINDEVRDFVELYAICNQRDRDNFSVSYDVPESDSKDYFSVIWLTKKEGKLWRIDTLNFNKETGGLLTTEDIFNDMSSNMIEEIIKLSEGHLPLNMSWSQIMDKINTRDIQLYIKQKQWYMVFNSLPGQENVVEVKLPDYFLQDTEDERAR